jgi:hypothetical protein
MRGPVFLAAACGLAVVAPAAAGKVAPETVARSCPPVRVAGKAVSVDVISGSTSCTTAGAEIRAYAATKPVAGRSRSLTVAGLKLSCRAFATGSGFAWRYVCMTPAFAAAGGGRLLPAADYRKS